MECEIKKAISYVVFWFLRPHWRYNSSWSFFDFVGWLWWWWFSKLKSEGSYSSYYSRHFEKLCTSWHLKSSSSLMWLLCLVGWQKTVHITHIRYCFWSLSENERGNYPTGTSIWPFFPTGLEPTWMNTRCLSQSLGTFISASWCKLISVFFVLEGVQRVIQKPKIIGSWM